MDSRKNWKVFANPVSKDKVVFRVYRLIDPNEPMHSGNIETDGRVYTSLKEAEIEARNLNVKEIQNAH